MSRYYIVDKDGNIQAESSNREKIEFILTVWWSEEEANNLELEIIEG